MSAPAVAPPSSNAAREMRSELWKDNLRDYGLLMSLLLIVAFFYYLTLDSDGVSASGGVGKILNVVIGALFMGVMNNGMSLIGLGIFWQQVVKGLVLLAAVFVDVYQKRKG